MYKNLYKLQTSQSFLNYEIKCHGEIYDNRLLFIL